MAVCHVHASVFVSCLCKEVIGLAQLEEGWMGCVAHEIQTYSHPRALLRGKTHPCWYAQQVLLDVPKRAVCVELLGDSDAVQCASGVAFKVFKVIY